MEKKKKIVIFYGKLEPDKKWHYVPYSALCVASKLLADGHDVRIVDDRVTLFVGNELQKQLTDADELLLSVYTGYQVTRAYEVSKFIRKTMPHIKIIWAGPHVNALPHQTLESKYVDNIITGYAERGEYPMPWELVNINDYINPETERFIMVTTYSCPGICSFCACKTKREWIELPLDKVIADIDKIMSIYPFKECVFFDATLFSNITRAAKLAEIMKRYNLKWIADARALEIVRTYKNDDAELLNNIVNSGLKQLTIGLESGADRIVQKMKKGKRHLEIFEKCARILADYDVKMCSGVIFGYPSETPEDIKETIAYIKRIKAINPNFYVSTTFFKPLPDTLAADEAKQYGYVEPDSLERWAKVGELNHFRYNQWQENPWIQNGDEYKKIYDAFINECDYLI